MKKVITYGTFDLLHEGHINILKRAKALGDYLVVGVTGEDYDRERGKLNVVNSLEERIENIKKTGFADEVIVEHDFGQKERDIVEHNIDIFVLGHDWEGKFDHLKEFGCEVLYLPRTDGVSSTMLRNSMEKIKFGVIGTGRISKRFAKEIEHVGGTEIHSVYSRTEKSVVNYIEENNILYGFFGEQLDEFFDSQIDVVYIATPHETHYEYIKKSLENNKHVLCEKPMVLEVDQVKELYNLANEKGLVLMEAIKTLYSPGFKKMIKLIESGEIGEVYDIKATFTMLKDDKTTREFTAPHGGALNELGTYVSLPAIKLWGQPTEVNYYEVEENGVDIMNRIVMSYPNGKLSVGTVGLGVKSDGSLTIGGTKGYIYVPAPWWQPKNIFVKYEDPSMEKHIKVLFEGNGLRYEISEFINMVKTNKDNKELKQEALAFAKVIQGE